MCFVVEADGQFISPPSEPSEDYKFHFNMHGWMTATVAICAAWVLYSNVCEKFTDFSVLAMDGAPRANEIEASLTEEDRKRIDGESLCNSNHIPFPSYGSIDCDVVYGSTSNAASNCADIKSEVAHIAEQIYKGPYDRNAIAPERYPTIKKKLEDHGAGHSYCDIYSHLKQIEAELRADLNTQKEELVDGQNRQMLAMEELNALQKENGNADRQLQTNRAEYDSSNFRLESLRKQTAFVRLWVGVLVVLAALAISGIAFVVPSGGKLPFGRA